MFLLLDLWRKQSKFQPAQNSCCRLAVVILSRKQYQVSRVCVCVCCPPLSAPSLSGQVNATMVSRSPECGGQVSHPWGCDHHWDI